MLPNVKKRKLRNSPKKIERIGREFFCEGRMEAAAKVRGRLASSHASTEVGRYSLVARK
jgi:hypothetical protein